MVNFTAISALTKENQFDGSPLNLDAAGDQIALILLKSTYTYSAAHEDVADLVLATHQVAGNQYTAFTAGGTSEDLAGQLITPNDPSGELTSFKATDHVFSQDGSGFTDARHLVIVLNAASEALSLILMHADLGADKGNQAGSLTFDWNADGLINW